MANKLNALDQTELARQKTYESCIERFIDELKTCLVRNADAFHRNLSQTNELLLLKLDDILCIDDVNKHETIPTKHETSELIRRMLAGLSLEDNEPKSSVKREKGKWKGIDTFDLYPEYASTDRKNQPITSATITTMKTTLAHQNSALSSSTFNEVRSIKLFC